MSMYYNCVYNSLGGDGVRSALNATDMGNFNIPWPDEVTQKKIAEFIDGQIIKVDTLISNVQAQIDRLKEYKQSVITEVVITTVSMVGFAFTLKALSITQKSMTTKNSLS